MRGVECSGGPQRVAAERAVLQVQVPERHLQELRRERGATRVPELRPGQRQGAQRRAQLPEH